MKVHVYSKTDCPFCVKAKQWLEQRNIEFTETILDDDEKRQAFYEHVGESVRTVPQVFLNDTRIGGFSELRNSEHLFIQMDL